MRNRFCLSCAALLLSLVIPATSFAYTNWKPFTPYNVIGKTTIFNNVVLHAKGIINSCSGLFEGNHYKIKVIDCENDILKINIEYKNKVNCDQGMYITKKFRVKLPESCKNTAPQRGVIINDRAFPGYL